MAKEDDAYYRDELIDRQIELSDRLRGADTPARLTSLAEDLATTLWNLVDNEGLWRDLEADLDGGLNEEQLFQLTLVDWEQVLRDQGVEEAGELADALISAASRAGEGQASWGEVKEALISLATGLEGEVEEVREKGRTGRLAALRERVAGGVSALRHINKAVLLRGAGEGVAEAGVPVIAAAVIAGVAIPPALGVTLIAAGVVGLGFAAKEALNRGLGEIEDQEVTDGFRQLAAELSRTRAEIPARRMELDELERMGSEPDEGALDEILGLLSRLRSWVADVGAKIAAEWPFVVAHFGEAGAVVLGNANRAIANVRRSLKCLAEAIYASPRGAVQRAANAVGTAFGDLDRHLDELYPLLISRAYRD